MTTRKLYLICPDCNIEPAITYTFGQDSFFITALGTVFDVSDFGFTRSLDNFIDREMISEIVITDDTCCTFIENVIFNSKDYNTNAEVVLRSLQINNSERFNSLGVTQQKELLAKLNIYRQAYELIDAAFIGSKVDDGIITVKGLVYNRNNSIFEQIKLNFGGSQRD